MEISFVQTPINLEMGLPRSYCVETCYDIDADLQRRLSIGSTVMTSVAHFTNMV